MRERRDTRDSSHSTRRFNLRGVRVHETRHWSSLPPKTTRASLACRLSPATCHSHPASLPPPYIRDCIFVHVPSNRGPRPGHREHPQPLRLYQPTSRVDARSRSRERRECNTTSRRNHTHHARVPSQVPRFVSPTLIVPHFIVHHEDRAVRTLATRPPGRLRQRKGRSISRSTDRLSEQASEQEQEQAASRKKRTNHVLLPVSRRARLLQRWRRERRRGRRRRIVRPLAPRAARPALCCRLFKQQYCTSKWAASQLVGRGVQPLCPTARAPALLSSAPTAAAAGVRLLGSLLKWPLWARGGSGVQLEAGQRGPGPRRRRRLVHGHAPADPARRLLLLEQSWGK